MPRRRKQTFCAPEHLPFDDAGSPWRYDCALVRLPIEHWEAILDFAPPDTASRLEHLSYLDGTPLPPEDVPHYLDLLESLITSLLTAPPITPVVTDTILEPMPNTEHVRMLRDVIALIELAHTHGYSIDSWVD